MTKLHIFELTRVMVKYFQPIVRLSKEGRKQFIDKDRRGTLKSITNTGKSRIQMHGTKTVLTFDSSLWEFDPDQVMPPFKAARTMKTFSKKFIKQGIKDREFLAKIASKMPTKVEYKVVKKVAKKRRSKK